MYSIGYRVGYGCHSWPRIPVQHLFFPFFFTFLNLSKFSFFHPIYFSLKSSCEESQCATPLYYVLHIYIYIYARCNRVVGRYIGINTEKWAVGQVVNYEVGSFDRVVGRLRYGQTTFIPYSTCPQLGWIGCLYIYIYTHVETELWEGSLGLGPSYGH